MSVYRYQEKKLKGEIPAFRVKSLPPPRREQLREIWRNAQLKYRTKQKNLQGISDLTPETPSNQEVPLPVHWSTPDHPVSAQTPEGPQSSPPGSPSPWTVEIEKLKTQLRQERNKNKVLMRRVNTEQRKATVYRKQRQRRSKDGVKAVKTE